MGGLIPLAQEVEDSLLIVGAMMCAAGLAFQGRQKMAMLTTGAVLVVATLVVTIATFRAA